MIGSAEKPFTIRFLGDDADVHLELTNATDHALKGVEVLTVFLKEEETPGGGPSQAHIKFDALTQVRAKENVVLTHQTWINGKIVAAAHDQLQRLRIVAGAIRPYVLDISWQDTEGKARFQRIPVGH